MPETMPENSVGIVTPQTAKFNTPFTLKNGQTLSQFELVYETYGALNQSKSNAVLICHALSGDHHAAGYHSMEDKTPGWWDSYIGPNKAIDTNKFYVVALNNLGGCAGSTGPVSINPDTGKTYGPDFPMPTVEDWVKTQHMLMEQLELEHWAAVIGGSLGGMQAMRWAIDYPDKLNHCVIIASAPKLTAQNIAFNDVARNAILTDPDFFEGHYTEHNALPERGLMLARMLGHITYLSDDGMGKKFGRELRDNEIKFGFDVEFQVESYLRYQGKKFVTRFDANTYLNMTKALDYFDPSAEYNGQLFKAFQATRARFFVASFTSDWRFAPERSREIVNNLTRANKEVSYIEVESHHGHDAFLIPIDYYMNAFKAFMSGVSV